METVNFLIGMAAIGLFGFATQRGGACVVASIVEVVTEHRPGRLFALIEASTLVGGGLALLNVVGLLPTMPGGYVGSAATAAGGTMLGIGALWNRSCAIGTIARIGAGQWAYFATPVGMFLGSFAMSRMTAPERLTGQSIVLDAPGWVAIFCISIVTFRLLTKGWRIDLADGLRSIAIHLVTALSRRRSAALHS